MGFFNLQYFYSQGQGSPESFFVNNINIETFKFNLNLELHRPVIGVGSKQYNVSLIYILDWLCLTWFPWLPF